MKIAILSMQRIVNIGSVLQAYSLREMVREVAGIDADFLDIEDEPSLPSNRNITEAVDYQEKAAYSRKLTQRAKRWAIARLSGFTKRLIRRFMRDELGLEAENNHNSYDCVIIGSDEVFNHSKGIRLQLHGQVKQAKRAFTYAASCGSALAEDIPAEHMPTVKAAMAGLTAVSVRDQKTMEYAHALYSGPVERHLDPVLTGDLYKRTPRKVPLKNYLLVYAYGQRIRTAEEIEAIRSFAKARGLLTVAIGGSQFWCDRYIPVSPFRAMDYFHFADYVVTDTFHGAVFSILHHRRFAAIVRQTNRGKLTALLEDFGLRSRQVHRMADLESILSTEIRYDAVEEILCRERENARVYLKKQLGVYGMEIISPKKCTGCGACMAVCSAKAIEMKIAEDGFRYPRVNDQLCTRCGQCVKICRSQENGRTPLQAYAALGHHAALVERSASGGVFATLAHQCVEKGGMVAGVVLERTADGFQVFHAIAEKPETLTAMQGSKYVQSDAWRCYPAILEALNSGNTVLFSGTPCQVSAVKRLTGNPDNLITMDLICHGVPSIEMLNQYARILGRYLGGKVEHLRFRDKTFQKRYSTEIRISKRNREHIYHLKASLLSFYQMFLKGTIMRSSCYTCPYAKQQRVGDLTIGDYWGVEEKHAEDFASGRMEKRSDWSCVLVNSEKGAAFLQSCADDLSLIPSRVEWVAAKNQQLNAPSPEPPEREKMMYDYQRHGYGALERAFVKESGGWLKYRWRMLKNLQQNQK